MKAINRNDNTRKDSFSIVNRLILTLVHFDKNLCFPWLQMHCPFLSLNVSLIIINDSCIDYTIILYLLSLSRIYHVDIQYTISIHYLFAVTFSTICFSSTQISFVWSNIEKMIQNIEYNDVILYKNNILSIYYYSITCTKLIMK